MGVDCRIRLSAAARMSDVRKALAVVLREKWEWQTFDNDGEACRTVRPFSIEVRVYQDLPELVHLTTGDWQLCYHFEGPGGCRMMMPASSPWWLAVGKKLAECFGGELVYSECDMEQVFAAPAPECLSAEDGEPWQEWQERIGAIPPLTLADIEAMRPYAAYSDAPLPAWVLGRLPKEHE